MKLFSSSNKVLIAVVAALLCGAAQASSDWVSDWFSQSTSTAPGGYSSQQRGYYTAGGFDARFRMTNDHLVSVQPPSIKVGCGGIDLMAGSMSYLNPQYLVQKLEKILQAAPAFAFDLAMQEYCKPCVATLQFLEHTADQLNQMQLNDCQAANGLAKAIVDPSNFASDMQGSVQSEVASVNGLVDTWENFQTTARSSNGASPISAKNTTSGCSSDFNNTFLNGSIVQNSAVLIGLDNYAPLMRGLVGDVVVSFNSSSNNYSFQYLNACPGNDSVSGDDFMNGTVKVEDAGGNCTQPGYQSVIDQMDTNLNGLSTAIASGTKLTAAQTAFINQSPIPLYVVFRDSVQIGNSPQMVTLLDNVLAQAYTAQILSDFYQAIKQVLEKADELNKQTSTSNGGNPNSCNVKFLAPAMERLQTLKEDSLKYRGMAQQAFAKEAQMTVSDLQLTKSLYDQHVQLMNQHANVADKGKGH